MTGVSAGTVTKVTSAFKCMGGTSVKRVGECRQKSIFDDHALV